MIQGSAQIKIGGFASRWFEPSFNFSNQYVDLSNIIDEDATWVLCSVFRVMLSKIHFSKKKIEWKRQSLVWCYHLTMKIRLLLVMHPVRTYFIIGCDHCQNNMMSKCISPIPLGSDAFALEAFFRVLLYQ